MKEIEVVAAIIKYDNKILCTQRDVSKNEEVSFKWEFPGGKIEPGEHPQEALKREIKEELDAEISVGDLLETVEWDYPTFHLTMHCFICTLESECMHLNEHESSAWLTKDTLDSVKWLPADLILLEGIAKYI